MACREIVIIMCALLTLTACRTKREALQIDEVCEASASIEAVQGGEVNTTISIFDSVEGVIIETTTEWSAPDSTGRQYPIKTTERRTERKGTRETHATMEQRDSAKVVSNTKEKSELHENKRVEVESQRKNGYLSVFVVAFLIIVAFILGKKR